MDVSATRAETPLACEASGADHIHPKSKGGQTNLNNGAMRSRPNNHAKSDNLNGWWNTPLPETETESEPDHKNNDNDEDGVEEAA